MDEVTRKIIEIQAMLARDQKRRYDEARATILDAAIRIESLHDCARDNLREDGEFHEYFALTGISDAERQEILSLSTYENLTALDPAEQHLIEQNRDGDDMRFCTREEKEILERLEEGTAKIINLQHGDGKKKHKALGRGLKEITQ